jgi:hypothetical protein
MLDYILGYLPIILWVVGLLLMFFRKTRIIGLGFVIVGVTMTGVLKI